MIYYTDRKVYEHISTHTNDPILEWKTCHVSGQAFPIYQTDLDFYNKISPTFETTQEIGDKLIAKFPSYYSRTDDNKLRVQVPTPTLCPEERQRRRLMFRNERKLYKRKCDFTGKDIVSLYSPDKDKVVYVQSVRWGDEWSPMKNIALERKPFSHVFGSLSVDIPSISVMNDDGVGSVNSAYTNNFSYGKNCYMIYTSWHGEDSLFSSSCNHIANVLDSEGLGNSSFCYSCLDSDELHGCFFVENSHACSSIYNSCRMRGCKECIGCVGLTNQEYCFLNKKLTREEYQKCKSRFLSDFSYRSEVLREYELLKSKTPQLPMNNQPGSSVVYGDGIFDSEDVVFGYNMYHAKSCKYYYGGADKPRYGYDITVGGDHDYVYECIVPDFGYHILFAIYCWSCKHISYSWDCHNSSYLFGCVGLRNKQYCIFNKQYTKEQRHSIVPQLIARMIHDGEWGEFFDPSLSPFGYNETVAQEYFSLTREEALARGYKRSDYSSDPVIPANAQVLRPGEISAEAWTKRRDDDTILRQVILCEASERPFMIQKMELDFYRKHNLPLPRKHPDVRHEERMKLRPGRTLYLRTCDKCGEEMLSVYVKDSSTSSEGQQKVYCEKCYQQEVFG